MPAKPCLRCGRIQRNGSRCEGCEQIVQRMRDQRRGSPAERGYDANWRRARRLVLDRDNNTCHWCGEPATTVDHLQPLAHGGERLDLTNLAAACLTCNSKRGGRTRGRGAGG